MLAAAALLAHAGRNTWTIEHRWSPAAGAALAASAISLGGGLSVAAVGAVWIASAALMAAYPGGAE